MTKGTKWSSGSCGKSVIFPHPVGFHSSRQNIFAPEIVLSVVCDLLFWKVAPSIGVETLGLE